MQGIDNVGNEYVIDVCSFYQKKNSSNKIQNEKPKQRWTPFSSHRCSQLTSHSFSVLTLFFIILARLANMSVDKLSLKDLKCNAPEQ